MDSGKDKDNQDVFWQEFFSHEPSDQVDILFLYLDYVNDFASGSDGKGRFFPFWDWYATDYQELIR